MSFPRVKRLKSKDLKQADKEAKVSTRKRVYMAVENASKTWHIVCVDDVFVLSLRIAGGGGRDERSYAIGQSMKGVICCGCDLRTSAFT